MPKFGDRSPHSGYLVARNSDPERRKVSAANFNTSVQKEADEAAIGAQGKKIGSSNLIGKIRRLAIFLQKQAEEFIKNSDFYSKPPIPHG